MEYLWFVVFGLILVVWAIYIHARIEAVEQSVGELPRGQVTVREFEALVERVRSLESRTRGTPAPTPSVVEPEPVVKPEAWVFRPGPDPVVAPFHPEPAPSPGAPEPPPLPTFTPAPEPPPLPRFAPAPEVVSSAPQPSLSDRLRKLLGDEEWETLVGGSLLNKLGALVLVIGIALFLGYSFAHVTAAGRASISLLVSAGILATGVWVEPRPRFKVFARGLIGAGWAAFYATSYAIYAVPEARIVENPYVGSALTVLVAVGMIGHSLRYRVQALTAVAYFAAFAALAVTPGTPFAVVSLIPLAASLLYLSARFGWHSMAVFGIVATYGTCIYRGDSNAPLASTQALFLAYWILFELFDLLRMKRRVLTEGVEYLFALNTVALVGLSYLAWSKHAPERLWFAAAIGCGLFLASAIARALVRPPSSFSAEHDLVFRLRSGSYEGALLVSAVLGGLTIVGRTTRVWTSLGLAVVRFGSRFLRSLGAIAFALSLGRLGVSAAGASRSPILGHATWTWTPAALFHAFLFYVNRAVRRPNAIFSTLAAAIVAVVLAAEVPVGFVGTAWVLFGIVLFEAGVWKKAFEFRAQAYALLAGGIVLTTYITVVGTDRTWLALAISLGAVYALSLRCRWIPDAAMEREDRPLLSSGVAAGVTLLAVLLLGRVVPVEYLALSWAGLALVLFELGNWRLPSELRLSLLPMSFVAGLGLIATHSSDFAKFPAFAVSLTYFGIGLAAWAAAARLIAFPPAESAPWERTHLRDFLAALGALASMCGIWLVVPDPQVSIVWTLLTLALLECGLKLRLESFRWFALAAATAAYSRVLVVDLWDSAPGHRLLSIPVFVAALYWMWHRFRGSMVARALFWAALLPALALIGVEMQWSTFAAGWMAAAVVLLVAGVRFNIPDARWQSYSVAALAFAAVLFEDIDPPRLFISIPVVSALYLAQFIARPAEESARPFFSVLATLLLAALLYGRVSGDVLTVSWGLEGLALLGAGFPLRDRVFRIQGLILLFVCILKLFLYDLRNLETFYRILSFIALGLILLAVSWIYTRFRDRVKRLL
jgi:uncharacterized membrane protein